MDESQQSLSDNLREIIEKDPVIKQALTRGFVNIRALARMIQPQMSDKPTLEAIVSAIRRYPVNESYSKYSEIGKLIGKLTMKNKIAALTIENELNVNLALDKLLADTWVKGGDTLHIVKGINSLRVLVDTKNLDKLIAVIPKKYIRKTNRGLAEIVIGMSNLQRKAPEIGVIATLTSEVALNGISLTDFMSCDAEMIVIVREKDALRCYKTLEKLSQEGS